MPFTMHGLECEHQTVCLHTTVHATLCLLVVQVFKYNISSISKGCGTRTRKKDLMVDLELPRAAKLSWWRLSGYGTRPNSEDEAAAGEDESESESGDESESEVDEE